MDSVSLVNGPSEGLISSCSRGFRGTCSSIGHVSEGKGASHGTAIITVLTATLAAITSTIATRINLADT